METPTMTTSITQIKANQSNAQKSTGPLTEDGKKVAAGNAVKHGIFSKQLILSDEDPIEYQIIFDGLETELKPVGTLEQTLVERIAITLWRQKRLVRSETAQINLNNKSSSLLKAVNDELNLSYSENQLSEADLTEFDLEQLKWCQSVINEYEQMVYDKLNDLTAVKKQAPLIYQQLIKDAETDQESIKSFVEQNEGLIEYIENLTDYCQKQIKLAEQRPLILEIARSVQSKRAILHGKVRDSLAKYQVMLDSELSLSAMESEREG
jgi:hypothetical protein